MSRRAPPPQRGAGGKDPDPAPRAPAEEADKRDGLAVTSAKQTRQIAAAVRQGDSASAGAEGYATSRASERARAGHGKEAAAAADGRRRTSPTGEARVGYKQK